MTKRGDDKTLELFEWTPPEVEVTFAEAIKPWASIEAGRISRAVASTLRENKKDRETIRQRMEQICGHEVSAHMLNNWSSEAKEDHNINLRYAFALVLAANDPRLLSIGLEDSEFAIIPRRHLHTIKEVLITEKMEELQGELRETKRRRRERLF
ncbi:hypothetical protein [uncultured Kiloniella sp.]|uniref:hypothetical protein n=1 Tax=uncultured Kiloniella sp. TaxID=1133091 RepID=UPI00262075C0|nr:hypothetical protein [uncultured Kiloniella sp.]